MAAGTLVAVVFAPVLPSLGLVLYLSLLYLGYAAAILALVWSPVRFARGWDYAVHGFDLAAFSTLVIASRGDTDPFLAAVIFLLVCGMIRWQIPGILWTALAVLVAIVAGSVTGIGEVTSAFPWRLFTLDATTLTVAAAILSFITIYQQSYQLEISRLATWPRSLAQDQRRVLVEIISRAGGMVGAPRVLLVWREPDEGVLNLAWGSGDRIEWVTEEENPPGYFVGRDLTGRTFQARDAADAHGRVVVLTSRGFRRLYRHPIDEGFRARFDIHTVQSSPLNGELITGRMFWLGQPRQGYDDLLLGEVVARLAAVRLDSFYVLQQLSDNAALKERVRLARDLHDSLLQSQAGAAMQLMAARRMLDRDPTAAKNSLAAVQHQLERSELEMRALIRSLRPALQAPTHDRSLPERLQELQDRLAREWNITVEVSFDPVANGVATPLSEQVYRLVQEGIVNAARHAKPSVVHVEVSRAVPGTLTVRIADDGNGFPFRGSYDLATLGAMNQGPLTLRERVAELNGDLLLTSTTAGSELLITLPIATA